MKYIPSKTLNKKFNFSGTKYIDEYTPLIFKCRNHPEAFCACLPISVREYECPTCRDLRKPESILLRKPKSYYLAKARAKHGNRFDYSRVVYHVNCDFPIPIYCKSCKNWSIQSWYKHICYGCACGKADQSKLFNSEAIRRNSIKFERAKKRHSKLYIISNKTKYTGFLDKVSMTCKVCNTSKQVGQQYFIWKKKIKCLVCTPINRTSSKADTFLSSVEKYVRLKFEREFSPGINRYRIDGFNHRFGIALEFNGDAWHGNLDVYSPRSKPHPRFRERTAYSLYRETIIREKELHNRYHVISVWEFDWDNSPREILRKIKQAIERIKSVENSKNRKLYFPIKSGKNRNSK